MAEQTNKNNEQKYNDTTEQQVKNTVANSKPQQYYVEIPIKTNGGYYPVGSVITMSFKAAKFFIDNGNIILKSEKLKQIE